MVLLFGRVDAGCSGSVDTALLILPDGDALGNNLADLLRVDGELDCLPYQHPLRRVPNPKGEGACQLQAPRHSGRLP